MRKTFMGTVRIFSVFVLATTLISQPCMASQRLYVSNYQGDDVTVYQVNPTGDTTGPPVAEISGRTTGILFPLWLALDSSGNVYVPSLTTQSFSTFPNPTAIVTSPLAINGDCWGVREATNVAFDSKGDMYVANYGNSTVTVYAPNSTGKISSKPIATIGGGSTGINYPTGVAVDSSGEIYVTNTGNGNGPIDGAYTISIYAANPTGSVTSAPVATIGGGTTGINDPQGPVAFDHAGNIYLANYGANDVVVFAPNPNGNFSGSPRATIEGLNQPKGVALDSAGDIYVANYGGNSVPIYAPNPSGNVTSPPLATIGGGMTGIISPFGVVVQ